MNKCKLSGKGLVVQLSREETRIALMQLGTAEAQVLHSTVVPTPAGAVDDGVIQDYPAMLALLKEALNDPAYAKVRRVVFSLCTSQVIAETVTTPDLPEKRLEKLLQANMDMYFPIDVSEYQLVWQSLGPKASEGAAKTLSVQLWAVPRSILGQYYSLANECGLSVLAIDYSGHSAATALGVSFARPEPKKEKKRIDLNMEISFTRKKAEDPVAEPVNDGTPAQLHLNLEKDHVIMTFAQSGQVQLQRIIQCGVDPYSQLGEIMMVMEYFRTMENANSADMTATVSGSLARDAAMVAAMEDALGVPTTEAEGDPVWFLCAGASQTTMDFGMPELNHPGKAGSPKSPLLTVAQYLLLLAGAGALAFALLTVKDSKTQWEAKLGDLELQEQTLRIQAMKNASFTETYNKYKTHYQNYSSDWETIFGSLQTYNDNLVLILGEIEKAIPVTTTVTKIDIAADGLSLQFACPTKEEAAFLIISLRQLQYATLNSVSDLTGGGGGASAPSTSTGDAPAGDVIVSAEITGQSTKEAPPTEGGNTTQQALIEYYLRNYVDKKKLQSAVTGMTPEQVETLEKAYGTIPDVKHNMDSIVKSATVKQRETALREMLTTNPFAAKRFMELLQQDSFAPMSQAILWDHISADITAPENQDMMVAVLLGDYKDPAKVQSYANRLVDILTKDEQTLGLTEKLIATDDKLEQWYIYYLEVATGYRTALELPFIDMEKIVDEVMNGKKPNTGDPALDKILADLMKDIPVTPSTPSTPSNPSNPGTTPSTPSTPSNPGTTPSTPSNPSNPGTTPSTPSNPSNPSNPSSPRPENMMDLINSAPDNVKTDAIAWYYSSSFPNNVPNSVYNYITKTLGMTMEEFYAMIPGGSIPSTPSNPSNPGTPSTPSTPSQPQEPEDTRYYFSVVLGYRQELIDAELERKGLSYTDKLEPLEVAK